MFVKCLTDDDVVKYRNDLDTNGLDYYGEGRRTRILFFMRDLENSITCESVGMYASKENVAYVINNRQLSYKRI